MDTNPPPCWCRHRSKGSCVYCGGALGYPPFGLGPCPVCPHGRQVAQDIDDANTELAEVYVFEDDGVMIGDSPNPDTLAAVTAANNARIQSIAMVLRAYPERIGQVEALLQIGMGS